MKPPEAAKLLGCSKQKVREHIRRGIWKDFAYCIPKSKTGKKNDEFIIIRAKFNKHFGL